MFNFIKNHYIFVYIITLSILMGCKLQDPDKNHGIVFLENRSNQLELNKANKNDVLKKLGKPHSTSFDDDNIWIYIERTLTKGKYHKLGKNIIKTNNVLILKFDKFGILETKKLLNKEDIKKINFSKKETENELARKSFVEKFLQSLKQKMYGNK